MPATRSVAAIPQKNRSPTSLLNVDHIFMREQTRKTTPPSSHMREAAMLKAPLKTYAQTSRAETINAYSANHHAALGAWRDVLFSKIGATSVLSRSAESG